MQPEDWSNILVFGSSQCEWQCEGLHKCFEGNGEEDLLKWKCHFGRKCFSPTHTCCLLIKIFKVRTKPNFNICFGFFKIKESLKWREETLVSFINNATLPPDSLLCCDPWSVFLVGSGEQGAKDTCPCPRRTWGFHLPFLGGCPEYAF